MTFTVTYRDKDGAAREECVEAANRAECFSKCRAKGILPLSMEESRSNGKTRRSNRETRRSKGDARRSNRKTRRSILAAVLVVAVLAGVGFWLWTTRSKVAMQVVKVDRPTKSTALAKEVKPAKAPKPVPEAPKPVATNEAPKTPARKLSPEERIAMLEKKILETPPNMSVRSNRVFSTGLEQSLAAIFSTPLGAPPPLISPRLSPVTLVHLQRILDAPNEVLDTDDEKTAQAKMACAAAKKSMKEYVDGGGDPEKFLEHYHSVLKQANEEWKAAQFKLIETMKTDPGLAPTLEAEINEQFSAKGMRPVRMPPGLKERYGIK